MITSTISCNFNKITFEWYTSCNLCAMFYQIYRISNAVYSRETPSKLPIRNAKLCAKVINESCTCKKHEGEDEYEKKREEITVYS